MGSSLAIEGYLGDRRLPLTHQKDVVGGKTNLTPTTPLKSSLQELDQVLLWALSVNLYSIYKALTGVAMRSFLPDWKEC